MQFIKTMLSKKSNESKFVVMTEGLTSFSVIVHCYILVLLSGHEEILYLKIFLLNSFHKEESCNDLYDLNLCFARIFQVNKV